MASKKKDTSETTSVQTASKNVVIEQPKTLCVALEVQGTAHLIQNNFSQKAVEEMLKKHMGITVIREKKKPREVIENATIYNMDRQICIPPTAFKKGMLTAASVIKSFKQNQLKISLFVEGQSIPIKYKGMLPRMDMVRLKNIGRTPDVRFRPSFTEWSARIIIEFSDLLSVQSVVDLLNRAGRVGVGEWRPERGGTFGTYQVVRNITDQKEIAAVRAQCAVPLIPLIIPEWALDADIDPEVLAKIMSESGAKIDGEEGTLDEAEGAE